MINKPCRSLLALSLLVAALATNLHAADTGPTAFALAKEGNRYVGEQAKDKVAEIHSDKSVGGLMPQIWYIVYYDPTTTLKAVEVKFGAGKMMDVRRPMRILEPITRSEHPLDSTKFKIDSDRALEIALKEPVLQKLDLKSTQFWLERGDAGPVWKIRFWATKLNDANKTADIGNIFISVETGEVVRTDIHLNHLG